MSAFGPLCGLTSDISRGPRSANRRHSRNCSLEHLIGESELHRRQIEAGRLGGLEIEYRTSSAPPARRIVPGSCSSWPSGASDLMLEKPERRRGQVKRLLRRLLRSPFFFVTFFKTIGKA